MQPILNSNTHQLPSDVQPFNLNDVDAQLSRARDTLRAEAIVLKTLHVLHPTQHAAVLASHSSLHPPTLAWALGHPGMRKARLYSSSVSRSPSRLPSLHRLLWPLHRLGLRLSAAPGPLFGLGLGLLPGLGLAGRVKRGPFVNAHVGKEKGGGR